MTEKIWELNLGSRPPRAVHSARAWYESHEQEHADATWEPEAESLYRAQRSIYSAVRKALVTAPRAEVVMLEARVAELEAAIQSTPVPVPVYELPGFRLRAPLSMLVQSFDEGVVARIPELDLWADGESESEAAEEAKSLVVSLIEDLRNTPDVDLGRRPRRWKRLLERVLVSE